MKSISSAMICSLSLLALPAYADELMDTAREMFALGKMLVLSRG